MKKTAYLSDDRAHRFTLWRIWDESLPAFIVIGLNPSTADEAEDDPTIRRCIGFALREGCGSLLMLNLFSYRATDPKKLKNLDWHILTRDSWNIRQIRENVAHANTRFGKSVICCAWGDQGKLSDSAGRHLRIILGEYRLNCLGHTKKGYPRHPLYLPADSPLVNWEPYKFEGWK